MKGSRNGRSPGSIVMVVVAGAAAMLGLVASCGSRRSLVPVDVTSDQPFDRVTLRISVGDAAQAEFAGVSLGPVMPFAAAVFVPSNVKVPVTISAEVRGGDTGTCVLARGQAELARLEPGATAMTVALIVHAVSGCTPVDGGGDAARDSGPTTGSGGGPMGSGGTGTGGAGAGGAGMGGAGGRGTGGAGTGGAGTGGAGTGGTGTGGTGTGGRGTGGAGTGGTGTGGRGTGGIGTGGAGTGGGPAPSCQDQIKNGDETDVDCGGSCPAACGSGRGCVNHRDCAGALVCRSVCMPGLTCLALKTYKPAANVDGIYTIDPDSEGPVPPVDVYCDMTTDGGGWMLVAPAMIAAETNGYATVTRETDARGGLIMTVYANAAGCGAPTHTYHRFDIAEVFTWSQIRARYTMAGTNSCWAIFGDPSNGDPSDSTVVQANLLPFERGVDTIREQVRMGGTNGDAFDGITHRCDNEGANFWHANNGSAERRAQVILRRKPATTAPGPAGLATGVACTASGAGTSSPTWWRYADIYIR